MNEIYKILDNFRDITNTQEVIELIYVIKAWDKLSGSIIEDNFTLDNFYSQKVDVKKLASTFDKLSKTIKLFKIYKFNTKLLNDNELVNLLGLVKNISKLPTANDIFYIGKGKMDYSVSSQIAELGVKLLDGKSKEIYVPFTNGFAYVNYTDKKIFADFQNPKNELITELINILENKDIIFNLTNSIENPTFINPDAPHLLKEFDSVLSFPPFRLKAKLDTSNDSYHRFKIHRGTVMDVAHFEHILAQTKSKAVVLMATGFTFSSGVEEEFRKYLIQNNYLEAIIQLPPNLHSATSIETVFFIINKNKNDNLVQFINLKDESFTIRDGRQLVLKSIDEIFDIYNNKKELENISTIVSNEDIANNSFSLAIDRYVIPNEVRELQNILSSYKTVELQDIAEIRRSQLFKDEGDGKEVYELSPSDFNKAGFTKKGGKLKSIGGQSNKYETYKLQPYDVLLSTKGTIGKVAIIDEVSEPILASQASQVIRVKDKATAIELYMFLKSDIGQAMLGQLVAGAAMPQIATSEIKKLQIPVLSENEKKQVLLNFNNEIKMYNEINKISIDIKQIHNNFLGVK